jgi:hypothetical protein
MLLVVVLVGCGGGSNDGPDSAVSPDAAAVADAGAGEGEYRPDRKGIVSITEAAFAGPSVGLFATLRDGAEPLALELVARDRDCAVYHRPEAGFCDPLCEAGSYCNASDQCVANPMQTSAGTIAVAGLIAPLSFVPGEVGYSVDSDLSDSDDYFTPGAAITASAPGDEVGAFSVAVAGVAPLVTSTTLVSLYDGSDAVVTWEGEDDGRVQLALRLGWHGGPTMELLLCETDDDGELTIPAALIAEFPYFEGGLFQVPSSLGRFARALVPGADIEFFVGSMAYVGVAHYYPD